MDCWPQGLGAGGWGAGELRGGAEEFGGGGQGGRQGRAGRERLPPLKYGALTFRTHLYLTISYTTGID